MNDLSYWSEIVLKHYGVRVELEKLDGELDLNFRSNCTSNPIILKVMRPGESETLVDMQCRALETIARNAPEVPVPTVIPTRDGNKLLSVIDPEGRERQIWVQSCLAGVCFAKFLPKSDRLIFEIGGHLAALDLALQDFSHPALDRPLIWRLPDGDWISNELSVVSDPDQRSILENICEKFRLSKPTLESLPQQAIHNDLNDYNILVHPSPESNPQVSGLIDLGDITNAPRVCDLAIAGAYCVLDHSDPIRSLCALVKGFHQICPLRETEIDLIWPLLRMRLAVSIVISTQRAIREPDDPYITISQAPAWRFLQSSHDENIVKARLRAACGLPVAPKADLVLDYLKQERGGFAPVMDADLSKAHIGSLSVRDSTIPKNPFAIADDEAQYLGVEKDSKAVWLGRYAEPRLVYTDGAFRADGWKGSNRRTMHLGVDVFAPAGQAIFAPLEGCVELVENRRAHLDYGGMVILRHLTPDGLSFYTLYGHLDPGVCGKLKKGQIITRGEAFAVLGSPSNNGGWAPHLHFQLAMTIEGMGEGWPGVADPDDMVFWGGICPNPAALLNLPDNHVAYQPIDQTLILADRRQHFGTNIKLSYKQPVLFLRGWKHYLFDEMGRPFLDAYNNVPHVGHAHPRIQQVAADQLSRMNSNTRYLHPAQTEFAKTLLAKMPEGMEVCYFVNSGSEANELALRLVRAHSGGYDMITPDHGYHGNTTGALAMSAYKFNKPGGIGQTDWVHLVDVPDDYRGRFRRGETDVGKKYAAQIQGTVKHIAEAGGKLAGFIAETFPSVGGQIIPPFGYLKGVYSYIRASGGLCIADEVQTGLGRLGSHYFGFETQGVVPDIIVLGKPIGNGHPLGVVVTTKAIAQSFDNGIEFFSTFGGSTLSCRIGKEVLDIVEDEGLQENARRMGLRLMDGLKELQQGHMAIGDVRGMGLFIGVDLVSDRSTKTPATELADYVVNRMRENRILIGVEGPDTNILKIRPPLTIEADDVDMILEALNTILKENYASSFCQ